MSYKKFSVIAGKKCEYMFATECTITNDIMRLVCPDVGGGSISNNRGCRSSVALMSDPNFEPKAVIFFVGTAGSYGRGLYWVYRFDIEKSGFYVRDTGSKKTIVREYNRRHPKTGCYKTTIYLIETEIEGLEWEPPAIL